MSKELEACSAPGCDNAADPRWFIHIKGRLEPACDGHGCCSGDPCEECRTAAKATVVAEKVLSDPGDGQDGYECAICRTSFSVPFGLEPTALCNPCAQTTAAELAYAVLNLTRSRR